MSKVSWPFSTDGLSGYFHQRKVSICFVFRSVTNWVFIIVIETIASVYNFNPNISNRMPQMAVSSPSPWRWTVSDTLPAKSEKQFVLVAESHGSLVSPAGWTIWAVGEDTSSSFHFRLGWYFLLPTMWISKKVRFWKFYSYDFTDQWMFKESLCFSFEKNEALGDGGRCWLFGSV